MKSKFFETNRINEYITQIIGLAGEQCYLIEGNDRALLFDGLCGEGSLKSFVRELTDLPVQMVLSHAHPDHCGAVFEYGECYMHPDDMDAKENYVYAKSKLGRSADGNDNKDKDKNKDDGQDGGGQEPDPDSEPEEVPQSYDIPKVDGEGLSPMQASQMLQAVEGMDRETKKKVDDKKSKVDKSKSRFKEKYW